MQVKKNIFEKLADQNICYSVGISLNTFINKGVDWSTKEYFIVIHKRDFPSMKGCRFTQRYVLKRKGNKKKTVENPLIYERLLFASEIRLFKSMISEHFTKVKHCAHGRIYELKDKSFKEYYDNHFEPIEVDVKQVA